MNDQTGQIEDAKHPKLPERRSKESDYQYAVLKVLIMIRLISNINQKSK